MAAAKYKTLTWSKFASIKKNVQRLMNESSLNQPVPENTITTDNHEHIKMEGYLFKRTSNAFKTWVRRWFMIQNNQLVYCKRSKDSLTIMEEDLRLCTVKPVNDLERRFCFEVVSPSRNHMLQADSELECQSWMTAIQAGVSMAYRDIRESEGNDNTHGDVTGAAAAIATETKSPNTPPSSKAARARASAMEQILSIPGNRKCCDCGSVDPRWASINLGITLCIECSGIHRSFGVHMSKVRSVTLDAWEPELLKVMSELGNETVNSIYEAEVDENVAVRATPQCNRTSRENWIKAKYISKCFVKKLELREGQPAEKKWGVRKRKRRSPEKKKGVTPGSTPESEDRKMVQGASQDSGLGGSTPDVIIFGTDINKDAAGVRALDIDSEESTSEAEGEHDTTSVTSFEECSKLHPDLLLYKAARARNLPVMLEALALGGNPNWHNEEEDGKTPLIKAVESGSMAPCELLLLNGSKVDIKDQQGRSPLHHATILGNTGQVCQFLKRNANQHAVDAEGMDPLKIAINAANADIVTLLRLAKLNEEMREHDGYIGGPGDETFTEVFRDFTNMANNTPEKLNRKK